MTTPNKYNTYKLPSGNVLELYEPPNSARGPMKDGRCVGCHNGLNGFLGHCACIRELVDGDENDVIWGAHSTNYGHYACVEALWLRMIESLDQPDVKPVHVWRVGTQREMILFIQQAGQNAQHVVVSYDPLAARDQRYKFRIEHEETE